MKITNTTFIDEGTLIQSVVEEGTGRVTITPGQHSTNYGPNRKEGFFFIKSKPEVLEKIARVLLRTALEAKKHVVEPTQYEVKVTVKSKKKK